MCINRIASLVLLSVFSVCSVFASDGLVSIESDYSVKETADRFVKIIDEKGLTLFTRVNHRDNAEKVDLEMRPTQVIIFGNPKVGTPLMKCEQRVAIDLPQKVLVHEDEKGKVWLSYNDPAYLKERHKIEGCDAVVEKTTNVLGKLSKHAVTKK